MLTLPSYVLITPARNEAEFIEMTIKSVVAQSVRPAKWVIVSDGSTDSTDDIVSKYATEHSWIELLKQPKRAERNFAGKAAAFHAGCTKMGDLGYEVIGNLDADITFEEDYFAFLMKKFAENPKLGVGGTPYREENAAGGERSLNLEHVSGACQMFRRECFEDIGGYPQVKSGGIDLIAVFGARAKGWQTRSFAEKTCLHHRKMGGALHTGLQERLHRGRMDYLLGSHPLWEMFRSIFQMKNKPYFVGGSLILIGYVWTWLRGAERTMPLNLITLRQSDQMKRLKSTFRRTLHLEAGLADETGTSSQVY
jgi:biofilm PGA synthesis N-glycosyltransferase PgaC